MGTTRVGAIDRLRHKNWNKRKGGIISEKLRGKNESHKKSYHDQGASF